MSTHTHYDVAIIGAGMSGLAAGIRLAHFGKRVCIFERHNAPGGLNGFYSIAGRKYDVGLHAVTNYVRPGVKGTPLTKLLRQLRIDRDEFALCEQKQSRVTFGPRGAAGSVSLRFTNDFAVFENEVAQNFPSQIDGFRALVAAVRAHNEVSLDAKPVSAREIVRRHIADPLLEDMLFCPVMYYGSAQEHDMEWSQFVIMFKALFFEGFARPFDGVRVIIRVLLEKYRAAGGERRMKCGVKKIITRENRAAALVLDNGEEITATHILSSIGAVETEALIEFSIFDSRFSIGGAAAPFSDWRGSAQSKIENRKSKIPEGRLSYVETITVLNRQPADFGWGDDTIIFFNDSPRFNYERPEHAQVDTRSGVICFPNNFAYPGDQQLPEGLFRCTCLANYDLWKNLSDSPGEYRAAKQRWFGDIAASAKRFLPPLAQPAALESATVATDMFTPLTITKFTGHAAGAIYGSPVKNRPGRTALDNVYLCGTDQGFLGIIGAMLSGISMANYHVLQK
ncbi:phytoene dehydrogenase-like protein [Ereboglobus sp. PH5-10]|uniref:phytoene desaturase family protein n=1 Tax=Ereboglobus sp. PH5-10 TaxID=2940629 RepID=UPI002406F706|nr:FAD-dependent oxidoreductase [Ereboglobus sp. PH5-10]MDF9826933.1 phytoene dehydrogenase-like protein [Ereboglobus sp. PH5-10]